MQFLLVRLLFIALAALLSWTAAEAATQFTPDCSSGPFYLDNYGGAGSAAANSFSTVAALCVQRVQENTSWTSGDYMVTSGGCGLKDTNGVWWFDQVVDACAPATAVGGGGSVALALPSVTQDHYDAVDAIFAVGLAALCAVAGLAWIVRFFNRSPDA